MTKANQHTMLKCGLLFLCFLSATASAWQPGESSPNATTGLAVDRFDRLDVLAFYNCTYLASEDYASKVNWTGSISGCNAGTTTSAFKDDVLRRVNYYRAMVGMPGDITFNSTYSAKSQEAALMMSAQGALSHTPGPSWACYTVDGKDAAGSSNLALGTYGPTSIDQYMLDDGSNNKAVGHRRWITYSRAKVMGTGDVPASSGKSAANSLWIFGTSSTTPAPQYVAWPNDGYVPASLVPDRWSLSYPGANFSSATVTMTQNGSNVTLTTLPIETGAGDSTIVWEPVGVPSSVTADTPYVVTVSNITGTGSSSFSYTVTLMDPNVLGDAVAVTGSATPPSTGQAYTFNTISGSSSYELEVSTSNSSAWVEGAEDSPVPNVTDNTSGGSNLLQGNLIRTGSKAFQLAHPSGVFSDQDFVVTRNIMSGVSSKLEFYQRARFSTSTTTLEAQISTDSGNFWTTVWTRNGVGGNSSANWDSNWIKESVDVSAYQGETIHLRYIMKRNGGSVFQGGANIGFYIDDITVTDSSYLDGAETTTLAGSATGFTLDSQTAGKTLTAGDTFIMRVRPYVGCRWFGFGAMKSVTISAFTGYEAWVINAYPAVTGGFSADHDGDGIANGAEYAFGLNPLVVNAASDLPASAITGGFLQLAYDTPDGVTGVTYGAKWSINLIDWFDISDTGSGGHEFKVATSGNDTLFIRHHVTKDP